MITDKELNDYQILCADLASLHEKFMKKKQEFCLLLEKFAERRREALLVLAKANRPTRHLTVRQRQISGLAYYLGDIKVRINQHSPVLFQSGAEEGESLPQAGLAKEGLNRRELRQKGLLILAMIDRVKKLLIQLDLLEQRCRELLLSINNALEAFRHEWRIIRRRIYPLGLLSLLYRSLRRLWGYNYFSTGDFEEVAALGNITGLVLKIADSPLA